MRCRAVRTGPRVPDVAPPAAPAGRRRNILFITTDQQRYDSLGCNGGTVARTPVVDRLAAEGINYRRAYNQNTVCMPARSTMLTGQYVRTHGVVANGIPLPVDAPSVGAVPPRHGGLPHRAARQGALRARLRPRPPVRGERTGRPRATPGRGAASSARSRPCTPPRGATIRSRTTAAGSSEHHPEHLHSFAGLLQAEPGGDTGAPETKNNPIPRPWYHTDWVADLTVDWLQSLAADEPWFCWMSFPDPHHPWDPPASELPRVPWRDLDLPPGHPGSDDAIRAVLARKPPHWLAFWEGRFANMEGGPAGFVPSTLTHDQIREVNAKVHVMNELIDEACGRVLQTIAERGWLADTDVIFTTDHGELQGDFGLLYKGPYHTDALMRLPFVWRPAPSAGVVPAVVTDPVGQVDLAPTFCAIAGVDPAPWMQGSAAPARRRRARARACAVRVGQPVPRLRHAPAIGLPRRVAVHRLRAVHRGAAQRPRGGLGRGRAETVPRRLRAVARPAPAGSASPPASSTTSTTIPTSSRTCGTPPPTAPGATTWSPISTPACRRRCARSR